MKKQRVLITGYPRTGKTTWAGKNFSDILHTDDTIHMGWSESSQCVSEWLDEPYSCIEGCTVVRALRKWMRRCEGRPADVVYWFAEPLERWSGGQQTMSRGMLTVWNEIRDELENRGVEVHVILRDDLGEEYNG